MAQAIRVEVNGVSHDDKILVMIVRENYEIYRSVHTIIMAAISQSLSTELDSDQFSQAIYDARMNGKSHIVVDDYQVYLRSGEEKDLVEF